MTAIALCCGLLAAGSTASVPKELSVEVRVCKGDPLGSVADGSVRSLFDTTIATHSGRSVQARAGGEVPVAADGKRVVYMFLGTEVEVVPVVQAKGTAWVEVTPRHVTQSPAISGFSEQTWRHTRVVKLGETSKYRISANDPTDQVWVEVTVRAAGAPK